MNPENRTIDRRRLGGLLLAAGAVTGCAHLPAPQAREALVEAARREGRVTVYSVLGNAAARPLIDDFKAAYSGIAVDYDGALGSTEMTARYTGEIAAGKPSADVVWSSGMDLQVKLAEDGYAAAYTSPEAGALPAGAVYGGKAYGTTFEPVVFIYNKEQVAGADIPRDHPALVRLLQTQRERFRGRVTTADIEKVGVAYMFAVQDRRRFDLYPQLLSAMGAADVQLGVSTGEMLAAVSSGKLLLGYNIMGAYALARSKKDLPGLGVVLPQDYTVVLSRIAFISRAAPHPNAARLWLDYLLSARGQRVLGDALEMYPIRRGVNSLYTSDSLAREVGPALSPIPLEASLARSIEPERRAAFLSEWRSLVRGGA